MRIAHIYLTAATAFLLAALALGTGWLRIMVGWSGLSLLAVGTAYQLQKPSIFRKRLDGSIPGAIRWLLIPFFICVRLYNWFARLRDPLPPIQFVSENLYIGGRLSPSEVTILKQFGIRAVLDVTAEFNALKHSSAPEPIDYLNIPVLDHAAPSEDQCRRAIQWIHAHVRNHEPVLVHCALGRGRSALIVAAYLMARAPGRTLEQALQHIRSIRASVRPNRWQRKALQKLHDSGALCIRQKAWLIVDAAACGGEWKSCEEHIVLRLAPLLDLSIRIIDKKANASQLARQALNDGTDIVIACGDDNTVAEVASIICDTNTALGIIPLGASNIISTALCGIEADSRSLQSAIDNIVAGHARRIDTARCNGKLLLAFAAIGFSQNTGDTAKTNRSAQPHQLINDHKTHRVRLEIDDRPTRKLDVNALLIANTEATDGMLDISWIDATDTAPAQATTLANLLMQGIAQNNNERRARGSRICIRTESPCPYMIDGHWFDPAPLDIEIAPTSLSVLAPA